MNCIVLLIIVLNTDHYTELIFELWIGLNNMSWIGLLSNSKCYEFLMIFRFVLISGLIFQGRGIIYFISLQIIHICHSCKLEEIALVFDFSSVILLKLMFKIKIFLIVYYVYLYRRDLIVR